MDKKESKTLQRTCVASGFLCVILAAAARWVPLAMIAAIPMVFLFGASMALLHDRGEID